MTMEPEIVVSLNGVSKTFRDFWLRPTVVAVDALSLGVRRGEVFGLLGPNGSGKSTTIKMILGLQEVPKPDDTADALAAAICHAHHAGSRIPR